MGIQRMVGVALVALGIAALAWGGLFWTDRDTVVDAGPIEITTEEREGVSVPPVVGILMVVGGIALLVVPERRRV